MENNTQHTTPIAVVRAAKRMAAAFEAIDPAQQAAVIELLAALREYVGAGAEALVEPMLAAIAPQDHAAAPRRETMPPPTNAEGLRRIAETLRNHMPPEVAAQLVIDVVGEIETSEQQDGNGFKTLTMFDKLCLSCRECYIKGFLDACAIAVQANVQPDGLEP